MLYFVKDNILHRFPVPMRCGVQFSREAIKQSDNIPPGVKECEHCMRRRHPEGGIQRSDDYRKEMSSLVA